jgi:hypothetical protein
MIPAGVDAHDGPKGSADLSTDGRYRYELRRNLLGNPPHRRRAVAVMLNPSTADHERNDLTITKLLGFGSRWGATELIVVNLFAYRATDPDDLALAHRAGTDIVGPYDDAYVAGALSLAADGLAVAAWGGRPKALPAELYYRRIEEVVDLARRLDRPLTSLGTTKRGDPRHPSRLAYDTELTPWAPVVDDHPGAS